MSVSSFIHGAGDVATSRIAKEQLHRGIQPDEEFAAQLARTRWLERNGAEYSFPCGVVPRPEPGANEPVLNVLPMMRRAVASVIAAVLPADVVFLLEQESEDIVELGRLPRSAIREVDVVDASDVPIPEQIRETFEPPQLALLVLTWTNAGVDDEDRFAFRSPWMAWQGAPVHDAPAHHPGRGGSLHPLGQARSSSARSRPRAPRSSLSRTRGRDTCRWAGARARRDHPNAGLVRPTPPSVATAGADAESLRDPRVRDRGARS